MKNCTALPYCAALRLVSVLLFLGVPARGAEVMACPPWEITVVDESGNPMAGCAVVQEWGCQFRHDYVAGSAAGLTDSDGKVQFPARSVSPPTESPGKKVQRGIDPPRDRRPAASVVVSKAGCKRRGGRILWPTNALSHGAYSGWVTNCHEPATQTNR